MSCLRVEENVLSLPLLLNELLLFLKQSLTSIKKVLSLPLLLNELLLFLKQGLTSIKHADRPAKQRHEIPLGSTVPPKSGAHAERNPLSNPRSPPLEPKLTLYNARDFGSRKLLHSHASASRAQFSGQRPHATHTDVLIIARIITPNPKHRPGSHWYIADSDLTLARTMDHFLPQSALPKGKGHFAQKSSIPICGLVPVKTAPSRLYVYRGCV